MKIVFAVMALAFFVVLAFQAAPAYSGIAGNMTGFAWSDTIGWISFNCSDLDTCGSVSYGISIAADGTLSGYAWSEHVGWVSADDVTDTNCPAGANCKPQMSDTSMAGWLKVIAASGGWDGWISLSGTSPAYGVVFNNTTGDFSGFAWGDTVVGWVDFQYAHTTYRNSCVTGTVCTNGELYNVNEQCVETWSRTCVNGCQDTTQCNAECSPTYGCDGNTITYKDNTTLCEWQSVGPTCAAPFICEPGQSTCQAPSILATFTVSPWLVFPGKTVTVSWTTTNANTCTVTGGGSTWTGTNGTQTSNLLIAQTSFTIVCDDLDADTAEDDYSETVYVYMLPTWREL